MRTKSKKPKRQRLVKNAWPVTYRWAAMGTLVAYSAVGAKSFNVAMAQNSQADVVQHAQTVPSTQAPGSQPVWRFDIPAGPLDAALAAFQRVTGQQVKVAKEGLLSLPSPGLNGVYTAEIAIQKLTANAHLKHHYQSDGQIVVELSTSSTSVDVTTNVDALAAAMPKYSQAPLDTPQTITAVTQQIMQQQGVTTLRDTLRNVAGISLAAGEGGAQGDNLTIRGFTARNDLFIDGMRDFGSYYRDPFNTQEVEVLQGPSSVTFGRGSTGGVVNQATKTPGLSRFISGDVDLGTDLTRRGTLDIDLPIPSLGKGAAFRLNVMGNQGNVAGRDIAENRRLGVAPSLVLGLGTATRFTLSYFHQNADDTPDYGIPWLFNSAAPVPRHDYYGFESGNYLRTNDDIGTAKAEHDLNSHVLIRNQVRYANYERSALITEALIPSGVKLTTPLNSIAVTRHEIGVDSTETFLDDQLDVVAHFNTGGIRHDLISGVEGGRETSDPTRPTWTNVPTTNLLNPDPYQTLSGNAVITSRVHTTAVSGSAYVLDTMKFGRHWDLTGGIRLDRFDTSYTQSVKPAASFQRTDNMPSWRAALVYKPVAIGSVYFAAGTSFNPSAEALSLTASNANLPPEKNRTYEFGTKWDLPNGRFSLRAAAFDTTKLNAREPDPINSLLNVLAGTQRVRGVQGEIHSHITSRWDILGSYAHLDARLISSKFYPAAVGARLANVPANSFNVWSTYRLPWRVETGFGGNFVSSRTASSTVPFDPVTGLVKAVPGYWVFNAMASRRLTEHLDLQANVSNIANRYYYDALHPAHIVLGPGRSALIGLKFKF